MYLCTDTYFKSIFSNSDKLQSKDSFKTCLTVWQNPPEMYGKKKSVDFPEKTHHTYTYILYDRNPPLNQSSHTPVLTQAALPRCDAANLPQGKTASPLRAAPPTPPSTPREPRSSSNH